MVIFHHSYVSLPEGATESTKNSTHQPQGEPCTGSSSLFPMKNSRSTGWGTSSHVPPANGCLFHHGLATVYPQEEERSNHPRGIGVPSGYD